VVAALVLGATGTATAAEPGVHVDPGSPAGKEYAIPLAQARNDAAPPGGGGHAGGGGGSTAAGGFPLFGVGVVSRTSSGSAGVRSRGRSSSSRARTSGGAAKGAGTDRVAGRGLPAAASTGPSADTSPALLLAIAVLGAGCLYGVARRRVGRRHA
jgi:hypothetical protein